MHDLLERSDIGGKVITLDALHTTRHTAKLITQRADYVFVVKGNAPETFAILDSINWQKDATGHFTEPFDKAHGRLEQRSISVLVPPARSDQLSGRPSGRPHHPLSGAVEERPRRCREARREGLHGNRLHHHLSRYGGHIAGRVAATEPPPLGRGKSEPSTKGLRLRRRRLPDPHRQRPGEPGQPQQHRARGDLRQPPRGRKPRRNPAPPTTGPSRGHQRPDPALRRLERPGIPERCQNIKNQASGPKTLPVSPCGRH